MHTNPLRGWKVQLLLFVLLWFSYVYVRQNVFADANEPSRFDLLHALVVHKTFKINAYHTNTSDKAVHGSDYYSDKAPGLVLLALPAFCLSSVILSVCHIDLDSPRGWLISSWITTAGSTAILTALGGVAMFTWLSRLVGYRSAFIATLAFSLGAAPFPYANMLFSHGAVIGLIALAIAALDLTPSGTGRHSSSKDLFAGFCCGLAVASEYSSGLVVGGLVLLLACCSVHRLLRFTLGTLPPLLLIPAYHWICFGDPFTIAYGHEAVWTQMHSGLYGIHLPPKAHDVFTLLFSPARGLFFWSPFLLLAFIGYADIWSRSVKLCLFLYLIPLIHVAFIAGFFDLSAGLTLGPRYLSPLLPLLALPVAFGLTRFPKSGTVLAYCSILLTGFGTIVNARVPAGECNPLWDIHIPQFMRGELASNLGMVLGAWGVASIIPLLLLLAIGVWYGWRHVSLPLPGLDTGHGALNHVRCYSMAACTWKPEARQTFGSQIHSQQ